MSKQDIVNELHKAARKNFSRRCTVIKGIDDLWQADLIDFQNYAKYNKGYKYVLVIIDALSKYVWAVPLKSKTKECVTNAMLNILCNSTRRPKNLQTDLGKEFYNDTFKQLMTKYKVNHYSTYSVKKASIVERVIRTIKSHIYKLFSLCGQYQWFPNNLNAVIQKYNNTLHRITKFKPVDVNKSNEILVINNILKSQKKTIKQRPKFNVGDHVRISKYKGEFYKGYTPNWSTEIFTVTMVKQTNPPTYYIQDKYKQNILGAFYEYELQICKFPDLYLIEKVIKRKGNKLFVKWLGLKDEENSWVDKSALVL